jgi:hypothetical protein
VSHEEQISWSACLFVCLSSCLQYSSLLKSFDTFLRLGHMSASHYRKSLHAVLYGGIEGMRARGGQEVKFYETIVKDDAFMQPADFVVVLVATD